MEFSIIYFPWNVVYTTRFLLENALKFVVAILWCGSLSVENHEFPEKVEKSALKWFRKLDSEEKHFPWYNSEHNLKFPESQFSRDLLIFLLFLGYCYRWSRPFVGSLGLGCSQTHPNWRKGGRREMWRFTNLWTLFQVILKIFIDSLDISWIFNLF